MYRGGSTDIEVTLGTDKLYGLLNSQSFPQYQELVRRGNGWSAMNTAALAALVVRPTTVANFTLFNNEQPGGKTYIPSRAFCFNLVSTAAQARHGMWLCTHKPGLVSPTNDITVRNSLSGRTSYGGSSICDTAMTVIDDGWFPWGTWGDVEPTGVLPGGILSVDILGQILVPPQRAVSIQIVSSVVGNTFTAGFTWFEEQIDIVL
jgi:hypothetical protein